jgi:phosphoserine phosphatase
MSPEETMTALHVFDMDGTLLSGSACVELSRTVLDRDQVMEWESAWERGELSNDEYYRRCQPHWARLSEEDIDSVFASSPWINGIETVLRDIDRRGEVSAVISMSPSFFVERLCGVGLHCAFGAGVRLREPEAPVDVLVAEDKVTIVDRLLVDLGLTPEDCVAYGDSSSDVPLFEKLPNTVAVNASQRVRELARTTYQGGKLGEAYRLGRTMLDCRRTASGDV